MAATIKDVAAYANVSIATVSRVMNKNGKVGPAAELRVLEAIEKLGYQSNALASGLRTKVTSTIGLVVNNIYNPFYAALTKGVEDVAWQHDYSLILCNSGADPEQERKCLEVLLKRQVDGIIVSSTGGNKRLLQRVVDQEIPVVQVDRQIPGLEIDTVVVDNWRGSFEAIQHLCKLGHTRIGAIMGPQKVSTGRDRLQGYLDALKEMGLPVDESLIKEGDFFKDSGYRLCNELLELPSPPSAIFAANNEMAQGAIEAIFQRGLKIPSDVAFVTFDDPEWATFLESPLTVIRQPVYAMGMTGANRLFGRILRSLPSDPVHVVLKPQLIVRRSCGVDLSK